MEKAGNASGRLSLPGVMAVMTTLLAVELSPLIGLVMAPHPLLAAAAGFSLGMALLAGQWMARWTRAPRLPALLFPMGTTLLVALLVRAAFLGAWRGGIVWRDTFYPAAVLREGARMELF
jgi:hypothetical protein